MIILKLLDFEIVILFIFTFCLDPGNEFYKELFPDSYRGLYFCANIKFQLV